MDSQRWVLIDGILGDFSQTLYAQMKMVLRDEVGIQSVDILRPSSVNTILENADLLARELNFIAKKHGQRLVLVAHSRGAVEVFLALLKHPNLLSQDIVAKVVLVQGAFDGSPLADFVVNNVGGICGQESSSDFCDLIKQFLPSAASLKVNFVRKERISGLYRASEYFVAKTLVETPNRRQTQCDLAAGLGPCCRMCRSEPMMICLDLCLFLQIIRAPRLRLYLLDQNEHDHLVTPSDGQDLSLFLERHRFV